MKIYVVMYVDYENTWSKGVFSSVNLAEKHIEDLERRQPSLRNALQIEEFELDQPTS